MIKRQISAFILLLALLVPYATFCANNLPATRNDPIVRKSKTRE